MERGNGIRGLTRGFATLPSR